MKKSEYLATLKNLKARAALLLPTATAERVLGGDPKVNERFGGETGLNGMIKAVEEDGEDKNSKEYAELVRAAHEGSADARTMVTQIRVLRTNNYLMARSNWLMFFNHVDLAHGTLPYWLNTSRQETYAAYMGAEGRPRKSQLRKYRERVSAEWKKLTSEEFEYPLVDPLRPGVMEEAKSLVDISVDMDEKISQIAKAFITAATVASWTNSGGRGSLNRTFILHSSIAASNIPAGNRIDATAGGVTHFGKLALDLIIQYAASWGKLFGAPLVPKAVLIPSADSRGILGDITLTSQPNSAVEQILGMGFLKNYAGTDIALIPDETLSADDGFAYVLFDQPIGEFYTMSDLDEMFDEVTRESRMENKGMMYMAKWISFIVPLTNYPKILRVKYK